MALFGQKRRLGKVIRIVALVAALSAACSKKNDEFVGLVSKGDRPVATQLVNRGGSSFNRVNTTLNSIKTKLESWRKWANLWRQNPKPAFDPTVFQYYASFEAQLNGQLRVYRDDFKRGKYTNEYAEELAALEAEGLVETARQLKSDLVNLHINLDEAFAIRIRETVEEMLPLLKKDAELTQPESRYVRKVSDALKKYQILELLKLVADKASRAGYENTSEAANKAILSLEAAMK